MKAEQIREALYRRWPTDEYVTLTEVPDGVTRMGRKIDVVAISCWKSRGYAVDAVEVKVTMSDYMKELNTPAKADFWYQHSDRFWVAVPGKIAPRVLETLPSTWGLLSVDESLTAWVARPAPQHDREALTFETVLGMLRGAQDAGAGALARARDAGFETGKQYGRDEALGNHSSEEDFRARVREFEDATGLAVARWSMADRELFGYSRERYLDALRLLTKGPAAVARARQDLEYARARHQDAVAVIDALLTDGS